MKDVRAIFGYLIRGGYKRILKHPFIKLIEIYFRFRHSWLIWFYVLNRKPRRLFSALPPTLNPVQKRLVGELRETGIAEAHLDELFPGENLLPELQRYTQELVRKAEVKTGKTFLEYLWDVVPVLDFTNPFVRISLDERVLDIVNSYMEMFSRFYYLTLNVAKPVTTGMKPTASQRWHRDPEEKKMIKLLLYLDDVDEESGPFIYIPRSAYGLRVGKFLPQRPPRGVYPNPGEIERHIPQEYVRRLTGKAGTLIFCNTTGFHKGGYATAKPRIMFTAGYRSHASCWLDQYKCPEDFEEEVKRLTPAPAVRYTLEFNANRISTFLLYWLKGNKY